MNKPRARPNLRPDHNGTQRAQFESNKKRIYADDLRDMRKAGGFQSEMAASVVTLR